MEATKNVLVCEDDPVQLRILTTMINQAGYRSLAARTPDEAVAAARRCGIDAVVADVQLQDGNAFDLLGDLRHHGFDAPMFMASAYATDGVRERARAAGVRDFFVKPFNFSTLKTRVDAAIRSSKSHDATVLLLESHSEARASLRRSVAQAGFRVIAVSDGAKALEMLRTQGERIELMLMDLHASGPSGAALIRQALDLIPALHVIAISGDAQRDDIRSAYEAGAVSFLRKPISDARLKSFLKASLKPAREARKFEAQQRERTRRLEAEPAPRKFLRWIKSWVQAPASSRRSALVASLVVGLLALSTGAIFGMLTQQAANSVSEAERRLQELLMGTGRFQAAPGLRRAVEPGADPMDEQIRLMRESNDFTRRYYEDYLREFRQQGRVQAAPTAAPQVPTSLSLPVSVTRDGSTR